MIIYSLELGAVSAFLKKFSMVGITLFLLCVIELLKDSNGNQIMNPEKACRDIPWGQVVMIGFIMVIATYMNTPETGVPAAMAK